MATRFAIKTGNWSDPTTWDDGIGPVSGDDVYSNGFTVTVDQNVNVSSIRNTTTPVRLPNIATPLMTGNTSAIGVAFGSGGSPFQAFDQNIGTGHSGFQLGFQFYTAIIIRSYAFYVGNNGSVCPSSWQFQGSNDNVSWTTIDTQTTAGGSNTWFNYQTSNTSSYTYYRINVTGTVGAGQTPGINEFNLSTSTATTYGGTSGGSYTINGGVNIITQAGYINSTVNLLNYSASAPAVSNIYGNIGASLNGVTTLVHTGTGTLNIIGNINGTNNSNSGDGTATISLTNGVLGITGTLFTVGNSTVSRCLNATNATVNVIGDVTVSGYTSGGGWNKNPIVGTNCTINVTGNLSSFRSIASDSITCAINLNGGTVNLTGTINPVNSGVVHAPITLATNTNLNIVGNLTAGSVASAVYMSAAGNLTITGTLTASSVLPAVNISSTTPICVLSGPFINNDNGTVAVYGVRMFLSNIPTYWRFQNNTRSMFTSNYAPDFPSVFNVRRGVSYNDGLMIGTMDVPNSSSVAFGVPVDNTTGSAVLTYATLISASISSSVWNTPTGSLYLSGSIGSRLVNAITQQALAAQLTAFNPL